jgi:predicted PurR-regulated permease PerM
VLTLAGVAIILFSAHYASAIVVPFLLALFITVVAIGPIEWLKKRGCSAAVAASIVALLVIGTNVLIAVMLGSTIDQFTQALPEYQIRLTELTGNAMSWGKKHGVHINTEAFQKMLNPSMAIGFMNNILGSVTGLMSNALLILFTAMLMLLEAEGFPRKILLIKKETGEDSVERLSQIVKSMSQYVGTKAFISFLTAILVWGGLNLVGLDFAILWAFLAFLLNFIPNIGSIMAAVPAVVLALIQLSPAVALAVAFLYLAVNIVMGNIIEPMMMGKRMGLSTLAVFLSLLFWGWLFGSIGMLLSVPLTMVVKFFAETHPQTQWLAILLGPAPLTSENTENMPEHIPSKNA